MKIYIDYDGPILTIKKKCWLVHSKVVADLGGSVYGTIDKYWSQKRSGVERKVILKECNLDPSQESDYIARFTAIVETDKYLQFDTLVPGVIDTLKQLKKEYELVMVTVRKNHITAREQIDRLQLTKYFSFLLIGRGHQNESGGEAKKRMITHEAATSKKLGDIIVGDSSHEIVAGNLLHIPSIVVLNGFRNKKYLEAYRPTYMIENITLLPKLLNKIRL